MEQRAIGGSAASGRASDEGIMRFVFIRHGTYDKTGDRKARARASLLLQGRGEPPPIATGT